MLRTRSIAGAALVVAAFLTLQSSTLAFAVAKQNKVNFTVRIENISAKDGLVAADGSRYPFALSPGFYAVNDGKLALFEAGKRASAGLEAQAEDGMPDLLSMFTVARGSDGSYGVFSKPVGASMAGPILPEGIYEFTFAAAKGMKLNLMTMYGQSNDLFYAPRQAIDLFDAAGNPVGGDLTSAFLLWDAGTEVNQAPGIGSEQAPRQSMKNFGAAEKGVVHLVKDQFSYPNTGDVIRITITPVGEDVARIKKVVVAPNLGVSAGG